MRKFDIRQKLRLFVLAGSILGFILFGMLSVFALLNLWAELNKYGGSLGNSLTAQIETLSSPNTKNKLLQCASPLGGTVTTRGKELGTNWASKKIQSLLRRFIKLL